MDNKPVEAITSVFGIIPRNYWFTKGLNGKNINIIDDINFKKHFKLTDETLIEEININDESKITISTETNE